MPAGTGSETMMRSTRMRLGMGVWALRPVSEPLVLHVHPAGAAVGELSRSFLPDVGRLVGYGGCIAPRRPLGLAGIFHAPAFVLMRFGQPPFYLKASAKQMAAIPTRTAWAMHPATMREWFVSWTHSTMVPSFGCHI